MMFIQNKKIAILVFAGALAISGVGGYSLGRIQGVAYGKAQTMSTFAGMTNLCKNISAPKNPRISGNLVTSIKGGEITVTQTGGGVATSPTITKIVYKTDKNTKFLVRGLDARGIPFPESVAKEGSVKDVIVGSIIEVDVDGKQASTSPLVARTITVWDVASMLNASQEEVLLP